MGEPAPAPAIDRPDGVTIGAFLGVAVLERGGARRLETLVLIKGPDGTWRIRHSHTSSRPARRPGA